MRKQVKVTFDQPRNQGELYAVPLQIGIEMLPAAALVGVNLDSEN